MKKNHRLIEADLGITTLLSDSHPTNAMDWIRLTLLGMNTLFNFLQLLQVKLRILVIPSGMIIDVRFVQSENADSPI